ncbi:MAG: hypothetical protein D4R72_01950 [Nitrosopumilales archaeon]|nr:MAG: hypothetical protein D4R72_01950 [Nitrosopumilales archaeon]
MKDLTIGFFLIHPMQKYFLLAFFVGLFLIPLGLHSAFAETWYPGEGLKVGDYYRYNTCFTDWHNCTPIELDFWIQNKTSDGSGYNVQFLAIDGSNIQKGHTVFGTVSPDPTYSDPNIADYTNVYRNTIIWLDAFATSESPKDFGYPAWGRTGSVGGGTVGPKDQEQVTVQGGTYKAWVIFFHKGVDNKIWVVPNMPFPVKGIVYADVTQGQPPPQYVFELLETGNSQTPPAFLNRSSSAIAGSGICPTDDTSAVHDSINTDTSSMIIEYRYTPAVPHQGCPVQWSLYFEHYYDPGQKIGNIQYDIYTVDDQGKKIGSVTEDLGKSTLFAPAGTDFRTIIINQPPPTTHYVIYVAGTGPENTVPNPILYGLIKVDVKTEPPLGPLPTGTPTNIVPEFPVSAIMIMALVVSMVILFTRFKTNFSNLKF